MKISDKTFKEQMENDFIPRVKIMLKKEQAHLCVHAAGDCLFHLVRRISRNARPDVPGRSVLVQRFHCRNILCAIPDI